MPAPASRRYLGTRNAQIGGATVLVMDDPNDTAKTRYLDPRLDLHNHSPDGFQWGYLGSGPAQLALALLADALDDDERAQRWYQDFKANVLSRITGDTWEMSANGIRSEVVTYETLAR